MIPASAEVPSQAMLLAAGAGERMRPLTGRRAKPSLPLMNRALLLHALDALARGGVRKVVVNVHHAPETIEALIDEEPLPPRLSVEISREATILGTSGGIRAALERFEAEAPILVMNADSLSDAEIAALAGAHGAARQERGAPATLAVCERRPGETYTPVHLDAAGRICGIGGAGEGGVQATFIGLHIAGPEAVARIPRDGPSDIVRDVYQPFLREGRRLGAHRHRGWWAEIGTPALYLEGHLALLGRPGFLATLPPGAGALVPGCEEVFAGPGCEGIDPARVRRAVLGPGCRLGEGCAVEGSVLAEGVRVARGARITSSILWENVTVPEGAALASSLVLAGDRSGDPAKVLPLR